MNIDNNDILRNWKENNSKKSFKELIEICKNCFDEGNYDCYFYLPELTKFYFNDDEDNVIYLPELTKFYFNDDEDNVINYFTYILFPLYLLKEGYIKIKS